jgi:hypothetical protein
MGELAEGLRVLVPDYFADDFDPGPCWLSPEYAQQERAVAERRARLRIVPNPEPEEDPPPCVSNC